MFPRIGQFKTVDDFRARLAELDLALPVDDEPLSARQGSPLADPIELRKLRIGNRWCVQPMEGWDGRRDGSPSELTIRRWRHFGHSGAKLVWGGEAAAVQHDGRANPNQLLATREHERGLAELLAELRAAHRERHGGDDDLVVGLQLTHSGRFSRPHGKRLEPRIAYHHPLVDRKFGIDPADNSIVWTDDELDRLVDRYVDAAIVANRAGFQFVDVKACHGYLVHELLSACTRPGRYGGDLAGRSRLIRTIVERVYDEVPGLLVGVRLSAFDSPPFEQQGETSRPADYERCLPYRCAFGVDPNNPLRIDLTEPIELVRSLRELGVRLFNVSGGTPYYNPHLLRPAAFPPSDGYAPPEDPLVGVLRQIDVARQLKAVLPDCVVVGSGYTYLQDFLPHVAQAVVRAGWIDSIGLGRMTLSYPDLPADVLGGSPLARKRVCRTFSDCTSGPRLGLESGCYPLDPFYKALPQANELKRLKARRGEDQEGQSS